MEKVEKVVKQDDHFVVQLAGGAELAAKAVIVATGAKQQFLEVPGEREYLSRGLCYSAVSYAPLFIDKRAVVIGGGDLALRSERLANDGVEQRRFLFDGGRGAARV